LAPSVDHSKTKVECENKESIGAKTVPYGSGDDINGATANQNNEVGTIVTFVLQIWRLCKSCQNFIKIVWKKSKLDSWLYTFLSANLRSVC